jgi:hypothetical protein
MSASALFALLLAAGACEAPHTGTTGQQLRGERYALVLQPPAATWRSGAFFTLDVAICALSGPTSPLRLEVDARMPEHGHGMNYRPAIEALGPAQFRARGLLLHMAGRWRFEFTVVAADGRERLPLQIDIE